MNGATIIESSGKAVELSRGEGLYSCLFEHELKATKAPFEWTGPRITPGQWNELLAFFRWTFDTEKSEAQARLFVHPTLGWKIWAFPQKGGTGMTTKEIENEDFAAQRAQIPEGYVAFGTVHHHCAAGAFQSGTDTHDERNVDGLHITVGKMGSDHYDIHCRLYLRGHKFEPKMHAFWDVGDEAKAKMDWLAALNYNVDDVMNREARVQMCVPPPVDQTFPDTWKTNYILPAPATNSLIPGTWCWECQKHVTDHSAYNCPSLKADDGKKKKRKGKRHHYQPHGQSANEYWDAKFVAEMWELVKEYAITDLELAEILTYLGGDDANPFIQDLIGLAEDNYMKFDKVYELALKEWESRPAVTEADKTEVQEQLAKDAAEETMHGRTQEEMIKIWQGNGGMD